VCICVHLDNSFHVYDCKWIWDSLVKFMLDKKIIFQNSEMGFRIWIVVNSVFVCVCVCVCVQVS